jgi:hypothetical protein
VRPAMALGAPNEYTPDVLMALCCNTFHTVRGDALNGWTFEFQARRDLRLAVGPSRRVAMLSSGMEGVTADYERLDGLLPRIVTGPAACLWPDRTHSPAWANAAARAVD